MSLRSLAQQSSDRGLLAAIRNAFALLNDAQIFEVCSAITGMSAASASDTIIDLVGPESSRIASVLPNMWGPASLADPEVASKVVVAAGNFAGMTAATKEQVKKTLDSLDLTPSEKQSVHLDLEKIGISAIDYAMLGRFLASGVVAILQRRIPALRYAENIPGAIRWMGTTVGGIIGAHHEVKSEEQQQLLPPQGR